MKGKRMLLMYGLSILLAVGIFLFFRQVARFF